MPPARAMPDHAPHPARPPWRWPRGPLAAAALLAAAAPPLRAQSDAMSYQPWATAQLGHRARVLAFQPGGDVLAAAGDGNRVLLLDLPTRRERAVPVPGTVRALTFSRDGAVLLIATDGGVLAWRAGTADGPARPLARGAATALAASPDGDVVAVAGDDREITLWSLATGQPLGRLRDGHRREIRALAFVGRGDQLVSVGADRRLVLWDVRTQRRVRQTEESDPRLVSAAVSAGGDLIVLGTESTELPGARGGGAERVGLVYEDRVKFYDPQSGQVVKTLDNLIVEPRRVALSADAKYVAVAERDVKRSAVGLYDVDRGVRVAELPVAGGVADVAFSADGRWAASADERGQVAVLAVRGVYPRGATVADLAGRKYALTSSAEPLVRPSRRLRFAVLDLDNLGVEAFVAKVVGDQLTNRLAQNPGVRLVERRRLEQVLREQRFQHAGATTAADAARLARVLNVQKVLLGSVARLGTTMTIYAQLVDVETAAVDGAREMQCRNCALEDLPAAVAEMAAALVAPPAPGLDRLPPPPRIEIEAPADGAAVRGRTATIRGRVEYSAPLAGVELVVNGRPYPASRLFAPALGLTGGLTGGRMTRLDGAPAQAFTFVQQIPLDEPTTLVAVRAVSADGNDEQRYVSIERVGDGELAAAERPASPPPGAARRPARPAPAARPPGPQPGPHAPPRLSLAEVEEALRHGVPEAQISRLVREFGVAFALGPAEAARLRALRAGPALLLALSAGGR